MNSIDKPFPYAVWLMPQAEDGLLLEQTVRLLSDRFEKPPFAPHATLCSGCWNTETSLLVDAVERLAVESAPVEMDAAGIDWTDHWAAFFFLKLSVAEDVFERAGSLIEGSHPPPVGPHLSLLYGIDTPEIDRVVLRQELSGRLPPTVRFDRLALARPATGRWEDVESWKIVHSARLSG